MSALPSSKVGAAGTLLIGLSTLLSSRRSRGRSLAGFSPYLCTAVLVWQLACYGVTALQPAVHVPLLAQSLGLLVYSEGAPALGYLLAQLGLALSLAALARSSMHGYEMLHSHRSVLSACHNRNDKSKHLSFTPFA